MNTTHSLLTALATAGPPPGGWYLLHFPHAHLNECDVFIVPPFGDGRVVLHVSPVAPDAAAHFRTKTFNILITENRGVNSIGELEAILNYYFCQFDANDPGGPGLAGPWSVHHRDDEGVPLTSESGSPPGMKQYVDSIAVADAAPDRARYEAGLSASRFTHLEKAVFVSDPYDFTHFQRAAFGRLYFGNEFCEHLLPTISQVEQSIEFAMENRIGLTIVTPVFTDRGFADIEKILDALPAGAEVVFNDWGLVESIVRRNLIPLHGRLLCAIRKDSRISGELPESQYHRTHNLREPYQRLLMEKGVFRVELDNVPQGYEALHLHAGISASLYYPFVNTTVTRKCVFANAARNSKKSQVISRCAGFCGNRILNLEFFGKTETIKGNAHFFVNDIIPDFLSAWNVNRIVFMPLIPNHNQSRMRSE